MNRRNFLSQLTAASIAGVPFLASRRTAFSGPLPAPKIRVGIFGTTHPHATGKLAALRDLDEVFEIVGVVEPNAERRKVCELMSEYKDVRWMNKDQLFASQGLQALVVETEFSELLPTALSGVEHDLFVHLDKPPGRSVEELSALLTDAQNRGVHVQMGYMFRYNPAFELCFRAVREGWLGRIFELNATISTVRSAERRKVHFDPKGGAMFDLGSHMIDAVIAVLGAPYKVTPYGRKLYRKQDDVFDNQLAVLEYPDALATVRATYVEPFAGERRQFVVCGENGTLEIRPLEEPKLQLTLLKPAAEFRAGRHQVELPPMMGRYHTQLLDFASILLGNSQPKWSTQHDLDVQRTLLQACDLSS